MARPIKWIIPALLALLWSGPLVAQISDAQVRTFVEALRLSAPDTGREDDGLYSDWQVQPQAIARWSRRCTGVEMTAESFGANPIVARQILECKMGEVLREQYLAAGEDPLVAVLRAAAWWMTGDGDEYLGGAGPFAEKVLKNYRALSER